MNNKRVQHLMLSGEYTIPTSRSRHIGRDQVFKLNLDGVLINSWGAKGRAPGELWEPQGLTLGTNNDIWVAGYQGHNVVRYNEDGAFLEE